MNDLRNRIQKEKSLIFVHIPKTAGTTLSTIIARQYRPNDIFVFKSSVPLPQAIDEFWKMPESQKTKFKVIKGHFYYGLHDLLPQKCSYITMLREPVDRLISYYYFIRNWRDHHLHQKAMSMSLVDFTCYSNISKWFDNGQTRFISGQNPDYRQVSSEILKQANKNIENYFLVGIQEYFDESLLLFQNKLQWKKPCYYKQKNVNRLRINKKYISDKELKIIEGFKELDIDLYRYAKNMFEQQISQQGAEFKKELERFRVLNKLYEHYADFADHANRAKNKVKLLIRGKSRLSRLLP